MQLNTQRRLLAVGSILALTITANAARAQSAKPPVKVVDDADVIVVTGSRISRPETSFPNPLEAFSSKQLKLSGKTDVVELLVRSPSLIASITNSQNAGSGSGIDGGNAGNVGTAVLDLRNLGTQRTLVLIDGRRHVNAYPGQSSVDINTIPSDLIESVEVLTGGVSAIYGADGVSGVVNFKMKRKFEGLAAHFQAGISSQGDAGNRFGSITAGHNFDGGRGNLTLAYEYNKSDRLNQRQRPAFGDPAKNYQLLRNLANPTQADGSNNLSLPYNAVYTNVSWSDSAPNGAVSIDSFDANGNLVPNFDGNGRPYDRGTLLPGSGGRAINSTSNTPTAGYFGDFDPDLERHNVNLLTSYEISPALKFFAEGKYVHINAFTLVQPSFDFGTFLTPDNYYLQQRFGAAAPNGAYVSRDNFDFGVNTETAKRDTYRAVLGLEGSLSGSDHGNLKYEASYVYGHASSVVTSGNTRVTDRYYAALDAVIDPATGKVTCRINLPGETTIDANNYAGIASVGGNPASGTPLSFKPGQCQPISILGYNVSSKAGHDFVFIDDTTRASSEQQVLSGSISGDFGFLFKLPGGPVRFALGAEYRKESTQSNPSAFAQGGFFDGGAVTPPSGGKYDVKEGYGEIQVPLLSHVPFADTLAFGGAVRFSQYSTIGSTTTWKFDGTYAPIRDITFRGTISRAVRAPNITELFSPLQGTLNFLNDPCDPSLLAEGTKYRAANCVAALTAAGLTPAQIAAFNPAGDPKQTTSQPGLQGGNPNLKAETAKTWTAGVVLRPRFLRGLAITADWYNIKLSNAINTPNADDVFKLCVDQPTLANVFCNSFTRSSKNGFINSYVVQAQNVAAFTTSGLELSASYRVPIPANYGALNLQLSGGYLNDLTFVATIGGVPEQQRNRIFRPDYSGYLGVTWDKGPLTINYSLTWQGKTERFTAIQVKARPNIADPQYLMYHERWEHDIRVNYDINKRFTIYGGVNNFTDQQPDFAVGNPYPVSATGRYLYVGANIKLDRLM